MTNKELISIANMELRDQLEAKEQMIKELTEKLKIAINDVRWIAEHSDKFDNSCSIADQLDNIKSQCFATLYHLEGQKMTETIIIEKEVWESTVRVSMERAAKLDIAVNALKACRASKKTILTDTKEPMYIWDYALEKIGEIK